MPGSSSLWDDVVPGSVMRITDFYGLDMIIVCAETRHISTGHRYEKPRTIKNFTLVYVEKRDEKPVINAGIFETVQSSWLNMLGHNMDILEDTFSNIFKNVEIIADDLHSV